MEAASFPERAAHEQNPSSRLVGGDVACLARVRCRSPIVDTPAGKVGGEAAGTVHVFMLDYWASFARSGVPTAAGEPAWSPYGVERAYMAFEKAPKSRTNLMRGMYEFNERIVCRRRANGGIPWHWNVGLASPSLPAEPAQCR